MLKWVTETVQNEVKEEKGGLLSILLGTLGAILLRNLLTGRGIYNAGNGRETNRASYGRPSSSTSHNNNADF